jgi:RNA polymerase sigma factor (sigma-70 family)
MAHETRHQRVDARSRQGEREAAERADHARREPLALEGLRVVRSKFPTISLLQFRLQQQVNDTPRPERTPTGQDEQLADVVSREQSRLRRFIRRRVPDPSDADDILQDVFHALVEANRLLMPIDHVTGWLFRVARNRIIDLFRARTPEALELEDLLPSPDAGPEAAYARALLLEALEQAIAKLPAEQRDVFIGHELEGRSFKEMAAATGVSVNTLLSRKRYAVLRLRQRLRRTYDDMTKP